MSKIIHGLKGSRTHNIYRNMRSRCENPNFDAYPYYGGRGIKVCAAWSTFACFLADMGEAPAGMSIERKDGNLGYEPSNCVWASAITQQNNKRSTVWLEKDGRKQSLLNWSRELGIHPARIRMRLRRGGTDAHALSAD